MYTYETVFITVPTLTDDEERALVGGFAQIVTDGGGVFTTNDRMGRRRLAYPIRKCDDGSCTRASPRSRMSSSAGYGSPTR